MAPPTADKECTSRQKVRPLPLQLPAHLQSHLPEDRLSPAILVRGGEGAREGERDSGVSVREVYIYSVRGGWKGECDEAESEMR